MVTHLYLYPLLREIENGHSRNLGGNLEPVLLKLFLIYTNSAYEYLEGLSLALVHSLHLVTSLASFLLLVYSQHWCWARYMSVAVVSAT